MSIISLFSDVKKYVNYDFSQIRDNVVKSIQDVKSRGFSNYVCELEITKETNTFDVAITFWILNDGEYSSLVGSQKFYSFKDGSVSNFIMEELDLYQYCKITFTKEDLDCLYEDRNFPVFSNGENIRRNLLGTIRNQGIKKNELMITVVDMVIYHKVTLTMEDSSCPIATLLTVGTEGLEEDEKEDLKNNHVIKVCL